MSRVSLAAMLLLVAPLLGAQERARDSSDRIDALLPAAQAARVNAAVSDARARALPHEILENRALELIAKGAMPELVADRVEQRLEQLDAARQALLSARGIPPAAEEVAAGAEALNRGVTGEEIAALARATPSGRSLAVPLTVMAELMDRGLASDQAIARVGQRLHERATDVELAREPAGAWPEHAAARVPRGLGSSARNGLRPAPARAPRTRGGPRIDD